MFKLVIASLLILLIVADTYIYIRYIKSCKRWVRCLWWLPMALVVAWLAYMAYPHVMGRIDSLVVIFFLCMVSAKVIFMLSSVIGSCIRPLRRLFVITGLTVALLMVGMVIYACFVGTRKFVVKNVTVESADLPQSFDGYKIVHFSDMHIGSWRSSPEAVDSIVALINRQDADLVLFTGDLVNSTSSELEGFKTVLASVKGRDGVFSVLGNHDYCDYHHWPTEQQRLADVEGIKSFQKSIGWRLLNNENVIIRHGADSIALIGVENWGEPPFPRYGDINRASEGTDSIAYKILMTHNPRHWLNSVKDNDRHDIDLTLSGHTHAMQLRIGGYSPASMRYPQWGGLYNVRSKAIHVNPGVGQIIPFRFGAWPEITVIILKRKTV